MKSLHRIIIGGAKLLLPLQFVNVALADASSDARIQAYKQNKLIPQDTIIDTTKITYSTSSLSWYKTEASTPAAKTFSEMTKDDWASFDYSGDRASDALAYLFDSENIDLLSEVFDNFVVERTATNPGQILVTLSTDIGNTLNADIYMYGNTVVKKDVSKAIKLYEESAQMGHIESKATLASIYLRGESVKKDLSKSFFYLEQSALWGNRNSWILMGVLYSMKDFSKYDLVKAGAWLTLYLEEGKLDKKKRDKLRNRNSDYPIDINLDDLSIGKRTKIKFTIPKEQIKSMFDIVDDIKKQIEIQQTTSVK